MSISAKTQYACMAMIELAARYRTGEPARLREIVQAHGIPQPFLVQIMNQLKTAGLVSSTRGATGGYRLVAKPDTITLADVVSVIEGAPEVPDAATGRTTPAAKALCGVWSKLYQVREEILSDITLESLASRVTEQPDEMYYI